MRDLGVLALESRCGLHLVTNAIVYEPYKLGTRSWGIEQRIRVAVGAQRDRKLPGAQLLVWGPLGDHTSCAGANKPHVDHSPARRMQRVWPAEMPTPTSWGSKNHSCSRCCCVVGSNPCCRVYLQRVRQVVAGVTRWRSTKISVFFDCALRVSSPSQATTSRKIRYSSRTATTNDHAR